MDIEEDIKILKKIKKYLNLLIYEGTHKIIYNNLGWDEKTIDCINAIEHMSAEREEDKKRIERLQVLEDDLKDKRIVYVDTPEFEENYIPKQKVKEILIEIQEEYNKLDKEIDKQIKDKNKDYYKCKENIAIMQTLAYCRDKFEGLLEKK